MKLGLKGKWTLQLISQEGGIKAEQEFNNGITDEGIEYLLDAGFNDGAKITTWYIGLIDNSGFTSLNAADTMASHSGWTESAAYSDATRQEWTSGAANDRAITNSTTVDFAMNATVTLRGIFITSDNTKSGSAGVLWSTAQFLSTVNAVDTDTLRVTYTLSG